jgi:hypothetical protein
MHDIKSTNGKCVERQPCPCPAAITYEPAMLADPAAQFNVQAGAIRRGRLSHFAVSFREPIW